MLAGTCAGPSVFPLVIGNQCLVIAAGVRGRDPLQQYRRGCIRTQTQPEITTPSSNTKE